MAAVEKVGVIPALRWCGEAAGHKWWAGPEGAEPSREDVWKKIVVRRKRRRAVVRRKKTVGVACEEYEAQGRTLA
jgi:hypothetical protein